VSRGTFPRTHVTAKATSQELSLPAWVKLPIFPERGNKGTPILLGLGQVKGISLA